MSLVFILNTIATSPEVFYKKVVLINLAKFTGKNLCLSLFFNKVTGFRPSALLKSRLRHRCFPVKFTKFLRTPFLQNTSGRLLLKIQYSNPLFSFIPLNIYLVYNVTNDSCRILAQDTGYFRAGYWLNWFKTILARRSLVLSLGNDRKFEIKMYRIVVKK